MGDESEVDEVDEFGSKPPTADDQLEASADPDALGPPREGPEPARDEPVSADVEPGPPQETAPASTRDTSATAPPGLTLRVGPDQALAFSMGASYWARFGIRADGADEAPRWGIPQRVRASIGVDWRGLSTFVQFQDVRQWGTDPSPQSTRPSTGVHQGYMELRGSRGDAEGYVRLGRQELTLGSLRLLGNAPWSPTMQAFDSLRLHGEIARGGTSSGPGRYGLDLSGSLMTLPVELERADGSGGIERIRTGGEWLMTAQAFAAPHPAVNVEVYTFFNTRMPSEETPHRERYLVTPGLRVHGEPVEGLEYDVEGYVQTGTHDGRRHLAGLGAATIRYEHKIGPGPGSRAPVLRPAVVASYVIATGEACERDPQDLEGCSDGPQNAFDPLFGSRHRYLGYADWFAPSNVRAVQVGPELEVSSWMRARVHYHFFQFDQANGAWTRASLAQVGGWDPDATGRDAGHEVDLRLAFRPWSPLGVDTGYAVFVPTGTGARRLADRPQHFAYLMISAVF